MNSSVNIAQMRNYLRKSISSINQNKLNGILAEIDFRHYISQLGFSGRVSPGGWIARRVGPGLFGHSTIVFFPEIIEPDRQYPQMRQLPEPPHALHTICATFHQIGIRSYFCTPQISTNDDLISVKWRAVQLGLPTRPPYIQFPDEIQDFSPRNRRHNFLRYNTDVSAIPDDAISEQFSKESLLISFQDSYFTEPSDVDGILWGQELTYPVEIKEKTVANDNRTGEYFGLDAGPFVKLAFYAAKRGNLHSLFVVREIADVNSRQLINWWAIKFEKLAQYASWVPISGGRSMMGGRSSVIKIPKCEFSELNREFFDAL